MSISVGYVLVFSICCFSFASNSCFFRCSNCSNSDRVGVTVGVPSRDLRDVDWDYDGCGRVATVGGDDDGDEIDDCAAAVTDDGGIDESANRMGR